MRAATRMGEETKGLASIEDLIYRHEFFGLTEDEVAKQVAEIRNYWMKKRVTYKDYQASPDYPAPLGTLIALIPIAEEEWFKFHKPISGENISLSAAVIKWIKAEVKWDFNPKLRNKPSRIMGLSSLKLVTKDKRSKRTK